ncbi:MAG: SIS domain-containing protein [Candidatus Marinimicrobia bacterium]|nr:SIS domain-containing protein [Candidatus Neomarinimicrobiota bacterium]
MKNAFSESQALISILEQDHDFQQKINDAAAKMTSALQAGKKILWCGNGGSAADCQHLSAELMAKLNYVRPALASIALTTDTSFLTAWINDTNQSDELFSRQVEALGEEDDILVAISTSGNSINIIEAVKKAKILGMKSIILSGNDGGKLKRHGDLELIVPSENTQRIQEMHIIIGHILCEKIENAFVK